MRSSTNAEPADMQLLALDEHDCLRFACSWATAVDEQIGRMLDHFLVHDRHDLQALQQLARSIRWQGVTIVVSSAS